MNKTNTLFNRLSTIFLICVMGACSSGEPGSDESPETQVALKWNLEQNTDQQTHRAWFQIKNTGNVPLDSSWVLYWNMAPREVNEASIEAPVDIEWINGDFYRMIPRKDFALEPGDSTRISYEASDWMIKESDAPLGVYLIRNEAVIEIDDYTILPFESPSQVNRTSADQEPIPDPDYLFRENERLVSVDSDDLPPVLPAPSFYETGDDSVQISAKTIIQHVEEAENEAGLFTSELNRIFEGVLEVRIRNEAGPGIIQFVLADVDKEGSYILDVSKEEGILIEGDSAGLFYATRSLLQLMPPESLSGGVEEVYIPEIHIEDSPSFAYRGFFMDISRNFNSLETLKRVIDVMALYKLNRFHIHLTEDEAWRIEIEEIPELTEYGSVRGHTTDEQLHLAPAYGSGPQTESIAAYGSGYYTRAEFKELITYAYARHIRVIPEFNVPGHSRAAVKSMEYRYRKYMAREQPEEAEKYRLADPEDVSEYRSAQWYTDNTICVCRESAFRFVTTVIDDILEMYEEAGVPIDMFHVGGDEVPRGAWTGSPLCQEFMESHPEIDNERNLQSYFFRKVNSYLNEKGLLTAGWEEVAQTFHEDGSWSVNPEFATGQVVPYIWNSLWGAEDLGYQMANAGYPVVLCNVTNFYFDLAYNKDPREPGLYWGGFVDTRDAFSFVPYDMYQSIHVSAMGVPYEPSDFEDKVRLTDSGRENILGIQAQLWSETVKGRDMVEYYILPKLFGLAERAWVGSPEWAALPAGSRQQPADEAWNRFANRIGKLEMPRLDHFNNGYNYRLPPPGAIVENGVLMANVSFPGLEIRYTLDGTEPTSESSLYTGPVE
ncbi:MAG: family 20 glycosylhydrolase, partial [Cyclobacteriaceae bacterium]